MLAHRSLQPALYKSEFLGNRLLAWLLLFIALGSPTAGAAQSLQWGPQQLVAPKADRPMALATADLNADGLQDVVVASFDDNQIAVLRNQGNQTFSPLEPLTTTAGGASDVALADLDGDGDPDVLAAAALDHTVGWYENQGGGGGFGAQQVLSQQADSVVAVAAQDLDGDGDQDVLSASWKDSTIAWYENLGGGSFGPRQVLSNTAAGARAVRASDLDGDGDLDVLSASALGDKIAWHENQGGGSFGPAQLIAPLDSAFALHTADLTGDGLPELLTASPKTEELAWHENQGGGSFGPAQVIQGFHEFNHIETAYLNGDSQPDVVASEYGGDILYFEQDTATTFANQQAIGQGSNRYDTPASHLADLDGDGALDVLAASSTFDKITWHQNQGNASFGPEQQLAGGTRGAQEIQADDFNDDGYTDLVVASFGDDQISWFAGLGGGNFGPEQIIDSEALGAHDVYVADLDGDGDRDIISGEVSGGGRLAWFENLPGGQWGPKQTISSAVARVRGVHAADFDGDGDLDVAYVTNNNNQVGWFRNQGGGSFGGRQVITNQAGRADDLDVADFNGDGTTDLVVAAPQANTVFWYPNQGGSFGAGQIVDDNLGYNTCVAVGDLNQDGRPDVIAADITDSTINWYENLGGGNFSSQRRIDSSIKGTPVDVHAADLDQDQSLEVLVANPVFDKLSAYENLGNGQFAPESIVNQPAISTGGNAWPEIPGNAVGINCAYAADVTGDGRLEPISVSSYGGDHVAWYENRSLSARIEALPPECLSVPQAACFCGQWQLRAQPQADSLSYQWLRDSSAIPGATDSTYTLRQSGYYQVVVYNSSVRDTSSAQRMVRLPQVEVSLRAPQQSLSCPGDTLRLVAGVADPQDSVRYTWLRNGRAYWPDTSGRISLTEAGRYQVVARPWGGRDQVTCPDTSEALAFEPSPAARIALVQALCPDRAAYLRAAEASASYSYEWLRNGQPLQPASPYALLTQQPGRYQLIVSDGSCRDTASRQLRRAAAPQLNLPADTTLCLAGQSGRLEAPVGLSSYRWTPASAPGQVLATTPTFQPPEPGRYRLQASGAAGCEASATVQVRNDCPPAVQVPSAFSPNGDGRNERLRIRTGNLAQFELRIYNRWGQRVFFTTEPGQSWAGRANGTPLPEGVYPYQLRYRRTGAEQAQTQRGTVTLLR